MLKQLLAAALVAAGVQPATAFPADLAQAISAQIGERHDYPPAGYDGRQRGIAQIAFTVSDMGSACAIKVWHSSGDQALDSDAIGVVGRLHDLPRAAAGKLVIAIIKYDANPASEPASRDAEVAALKRADEAVRPGPAQLRCDA